MSFLKDIGRGIRENPLSLTLGATGAFLTGRSGREAEASEAAAAAAKQNSELERANYYKQAGRNKIMDLYGSSSQGIGQDASAYTDRVRGGLDKNIAKSQQFLQNNAANMAKQNAKAGLRGVDTTAMNFQNQMSAKYGADVVNEQGKRDALDLYGKNIAARQGGVNQLDMAYEALAQGSKAAEIPQYKPGIFGNLFGLLG